MNNVDLSGQWSISGLVKSVVNIVKRAVAKIVRVVVPVPRVASVSKAAPKQQAKKQPAKKQQPQKGVFIDQIEWENKTRVKIYPSAAGRFGALNSKNPLSFSISGTAGNLAWRETTIRDPRIDTPGMKDQFMCHWDFAGLKDSWNLDNNQPDVGYIRTVLQACNPEYQENETDFKGCKQYEGE